jgi:hypothetical protein
VDAEIEVERRRHAHRAEIGGPVATGSDVVELRQVRNLAKVADAAAVDGRHADVIDELLFDEPVALVDRREHLADGDGRRRVMADEAESFLKLGRNRIFEPEQPGWLERLADGRRLDRRQAVVNVVQKMDVGTDFFSYAFEEKRHRDHVALGAPLALEHPFSAGS